MELQTWSFNRECSFVAPIVKFLFSYAVHNRRNNSNKSYSPCMERCDALGQSKQIILCIDLNVGGCDGR